MIVAVAGVLAAGGAAAATSSAGAALPCGPAGARTLAASQQARVYVSGGIVYGCASNARKRIRLGEETSCIGTPLIDPVRVTGGLAAYGSETCGIDTGSTVVVVRRLTDGRQLRSKPATSPVGPESYESVTSLVVARDGAVGWIATGQSVGNHHAVVEVWRSDRRGTARLDSGSAVRSRSLRLTGSTLRWRHGTGTRTAPLH
jgi:hypothetical protein